LGELNKEIAMRYTIILVILIFFIGCSTKDKNALPRDLMLYPQTFENYTNIYTQEKTQDMLAFEKHYFEPWHYEKAPYTLKEILWPYNSYTKGIIYGATLKQVNKSWFDTIKEESNFQSFDIIKKYALTLNYGHLRNFPTDKPLFRDPHHAGEGFPFDYNQNSGVHANEPLYLSHYSKRGDWVYVFTSYASGWLHVNNIQIINSQHRKLWEHSKHIYVTEDNVALYNKNNHYLLEARIGMLFPFIAEDKTDYYILLAKDFSKSKIAKTKASLNPIKLNSKNISRIGNRLLNQDYGWGGIYEDRDCSSMLRDYFATFGIWLPRNSYQQSKIGKVISLKNYDNSAKIMRIKNEAVPFETLLYKQGHIMLYLGIYNDKIMIFHNTWGVKTISFTGTEGRHIVGKSVISSLSLGEDIYDYDLNSNMLSKLKSFNIITAKP
jgi:hypothetical protein